MDSGFILKESSTGFAKGLEVGCEIPRGGKEDSKTFALNDWKVGVTLYRFGETESSTLGGESRV